LVIGRRSGLIVDKEWWGMGWSVSQVSCPPHLRRFWQRFGEWGWVRPERSVRRSEPLPTCCYELGTGVCWVKLGDTGAHNGS
jgi:hypothetical protein